MNTRNVIFIGIVILGLVVVALAVFGLLALLAVTPVKMETSNNAQEAPAEVMETAPAADPQRLLIPRWFLRSLVLDGREVPLPADQQAVTIQFEEGGAANGTGGCNQYFTTYQAAANGQLRFGEIGATKMGCDLLSIEIDYFQALAKVEHFNTEDFKLTLSSADGRSTLVFEMPPK